MSGYAISVKVIGSEELKNAFLKAPKQVAKEIGGAIEKTALETQRKAVEYAPHRFGDLQRSITTKGPFVTQDNIFAKVGTDKNYALFQEQGTGLYGPEHRLIVPKTAKALYALDRSGRIAGFFKSSKGTKPKWFMKKAHEEAKPILTDYMRTAIARIVDFLATAK